MPADQLILAILNLGLIALALGVFLTMLFRGAFHEKSLRLGPTRDLHQPAWVYAVGIGGVGLYSACKLFVRGEQPTSVLLVIELIPYAMIGLLLGRARVAEAGFRKLGILPRWPIRDTGWGLAGGIVGLGLAGAVGLVVNLISEALGQPVDPVAHEALKTLREEFSMNLLIALIISAVFLAPLVEEFVFRGIFQTSLLRLFRGMRWPGLIVASAVFSVIHIAVVPWQGLIPLFVLGLVWGYLYERTGSLLVPILSHAVFNAANIVLALHLPEQLPQ
ncbi:MAG: CPBP family intramembrane glutamic endopeptidase [Planctomycetota bacterium]